LIRVQVPGPHARVEARHGAHRELDALEARLQLGQVAVSVGLLHVREEADERPLVGAALEDGGEYLPVTWLLGHGVATRGRSTPRDNLRLKIVLHQARCSFLAVSSLANRLTLSPTTPNTTPSGGNRVETIGLSTTSSMSLVTW